MQGGIYPSRDARLHVNEAPNYIISQVKKHKAMAIAKLRKQGDGLWGTEEETKGE